MTNSVDVFDLLRTVRAAGSADVHLAPVDWASPPQDPTLCSLQIAAAASQSFRTSPCMRCATRALRAGVLGIRDAEQVVLNLGRLVESCTPD